jgi:hypothetical protein
LNKSLKGCGGISKVIRHNKMFKKTKWCLKCCFPLVALFDTEVAIGKLEINNRENFTTLYMIEEIMD